MLPGTSCSTVNRRSIDGLAATQDHRSAALASCSAGWASVPPGERVRERPARARQRERVGGRLPGEPRREEPGIEAVAGAGRVDHRNGHRRVLGDSLRRADERAARARCDGRRDRRRRQLRCRVPRSVSFRRGAARRRARAGVRVRGALDPARREGPMPAGAGRGEGGAPVILCVAANRRSTALFTVEELVPGSLHRPAELRPAGRSGLNVARAAATLGRVGVRCRSSAGTPAMDRAARGERAARGHVGRGRTRSSLSVAGALEGLAEFLAPGCRRRVGDFAELGHGP